MAVAKGSRLSAVVCRRDALDVTVGEPSRLAAASRRRRLTQALGKDVGDEIINMKEEERQKLIKDQRDKQRKAEQNEAKKMLEQSKRLDYITRALRLEELPVLEARYAKRLEEDRARHDAQYVESVEKGKVDHAAALLEKKRLARVQAHREKWEAGVLAARKAAYARDRAAAEEEHKTNAIARKVARARRRREEYLDDLERARAEDEERAYEAAADALRMEEERAYEAQQAERRAAEEAQRRHLCRNQIRASHAIDVVM